MSFEIEAVQPSCFDPPHIGRGTQLRNKPSFLFLGNANNERAWGGITGSITRRQPLLRFIPLRRRCSSQPALMHTYSSRRHTPLTDCMHTYIHARPGSLTLREQ